MLLTEWPAVKTTVEELPESRVRLEVEVPEADVQHAMEHAASDLAASLRIPGFRKGKAPVQVVVARVGREALWEEAVRSHLDSWFWNAAASSGIRPVANPEVDFGDGPPPETGEAFRFTATVAVVPTPELADWTTLEVGVPEAEVPGEIVDAELERLREAAAELSPVDGRPAQPGDVVVLDLEGDEIGATQRDYVVEIGSGRLVDEIEAALVGMSAGRDAGDRVRARRRAEGDGHGERQRDPGEGPAAARGRPRPGGQRVRDARGAARRHRGAAARAARR